MNLSRQSLLTLATILVAWAAGQPAEAALREANGTAVRIEVEYILPSAGVSANELGTVGNFGTLHWVGRRSSNANGTVESTSEAPAVLFSGPPSELSLANASVAENEAVGTVVGALSVTHMDNPTFSLTDDAGGRFAVGGSNLTTGAILDHEANATRHVTVRATDPNGGYVEKAFSIAIVDDDTEDVDDDGLNEGEEEILGTSDLNADTDGDGFSDAKEKAAGSDPLDDQSLPAWLPTNYTLTPGEVTENRPAGTFAGKLTFTDPDGNRSYIYALVADENQSTLDNGLFAIDANGSLSTTAQLDYEAAPERRARVQVKDDFNRTAAATLTIKVLDLDEVAPVITLTGDANATHEAGTTWTEPGYTAVDAVDGNLTGSATISGTVNAGTKGAYSLTYSVSDLAGNAASVTRVVTAQDTTSPVITLLGDANATHETETPYVDAGATWTDSVDGEGPVSATGAVNVDVPGVYLLTYDFTDNAGNAATTVVRRVEVMEKIPGEIMAAGLQVEENLPVGAVVATFSMLLDANITRTYHFSLVVDEGSIGGGSFVLDANGTLRTTAVLDFEEQESHSILVRSTASGILVEKAFVVKVIDAFAPIVETLEPEEGATEGVLLLAGDVLDAGGSQGVTERGFAVGRNPDPEMGDPGVTTLAAGQGDGRFEATPHNLIEGKRYYYRAYALNGEGISYGTQERFTAPKEPSGPKWARAFASGQAADWWTSPWFGSFFLAKNGWLRHESLGWLYSAGDGVGGVWLWQENIGWLWTGEGIHPYLFGHGSGGWHYFMGEVGGRVFLYRYADGAWIDVEEGKGQI